METSTSPPTARTSARSMQLGTSGRTARGLVPDRVEAGADRAHHPARGPEQAGESDEAREAERARDPRRRPARGRPPPRPTAAGGRAASPSPPGAHRRPGGRARGSRRARSRAETVRRGRGRRSRPRTASRGGDRTRRRRARAPARAARPRPQHAREPPASTTTLPAGGPRVQAYCPGSNNQGAARSSLVAASGSARSGGGSRPAQTGRLTDTHAHARAGSEPKE